MDAMCLLCCVFFFFKQKTAYEMRISDWSSDVCSSDLIAAALIARLGERYTVVGLDRAGPPDPPPPAAAIDIDVESDEAVRVALDEVRARYGNRIASVIHLEIGRASGRDRVCQYV